MKKTSKRATSRKNVTKKRRGKRGNLKDITQIASGINLLLQKKKRKLNNKKICLT